MFWLNQSPYFFLIFIFDSIKKTPGFYSGHPVKKEFCIPFLSRALTEPVFTGSYLS
jgi:hypothetical protein